MLSCLIDAAREKISVSNYKHILVHISEYLLNFSMFSDILTIRLALEKKLYQLIISRLNGEEIHVKSYQKKTFRLIEKGIGGFIIFGGKKEEIRNFINKMQSVSEMPLFVASDIERGAGQQIQGCTSFPCQMAMAAATDTDRPEDLLKLRDAVNAIADEAKDVGINMPLIPVLDVNRDPDNPIVCTRAFSDSPADVARLGSEYVKILESSNLISCAKHFPGHGDTSEDSHILLPVIRKSYKDLIEMDIMPFKEAISAGVSSIMIGHLSIPVIDHKPASISKKLISNMLRDEMGFDGLILTDALTMKALQDIRNVYSQCIEAGADVLLHPEDPDSTVKELMHAVKTQEITENQIDAAFQRIVKAKKKIANIERRVVDYHRNAGLSMQITDTSISLLKNTPGILPVSDKNKVQLIFAGDNELFEASPLKNYFKNVSTIDEKIELRNSLVIFAIFTSIAAWKGSSGIDENEKSCIHEIIKKTKQSIIISFGSPYVLRHFKEADMLIAAYEATEQAQRAVIKCLESQLDFKGYLPVKIDL
jgi:beta-N-acetylhexosaminidase